MNDLDGTPSAINEEYLSVLCLIEIRIDRAIGLPGLPESARDFLIDLEREIEKRFIPAVRWQLKTMENRRTHYKKDQPLFQLGGMQL